MKAKNTAQISLFVEEPLAAHSAKALVEEPTPAVAPGELPFEIFVDGKWCEVTPRTVKGSEIFVVAGLFDKPVFVTFAARNTGELFWTSVPEGRQALAEKIGQQIDIHLKK